MTALRRPVFGSPAPVASEDCIPDGVGPGSDRRVDRARLGPGGGEVGGGSADGIDTTGEATTHRQRRNVVGLNIRLDAGQYESFEDRCKYS
jgi:hypothetical protein